MRLSFSASFFTLDVTFFEPAADDSAASEEWHVGTAGQFEPAPPLTSWDEAGDRAIGFRPSSHSH